MTVAELITLSRINAQDTNAAAARQPVGTTNYLAIANDVARIWRARIDRRVQYVNHSTLGNPVSGLVEFSTDGTPNIRQVVAAYLLDDGVPGNASITKVSAATHIPLRWAAPHRMKYLQAAGGLPLGIAEAAAGRALGLYYSHEFLSGEFTKLHMMFNFQIGYISLEARLFHTDWTAIDATVVDADNDDCSAMALAIGNIAGNLLDKEPTYLQMLQQRMPEVWRTVFSAEWNALIGDRRRETGDARSAS